MSSKLPNAIIKLLGAASRPLKAWEIADELADTGVFERGAGRSDRRRAINHCLYGPLRGEVEKDADSHRWRLTPASRASAASSAKASQPPRTNRNNAAPSAAAPCAQVKGATSPQSPPATKRPGNPPASGHTGSGRPRGRPTRSAATPSTDSSTAVPEDFSWLRLDPGEPSLAPPAGARPDDRARQLFNETGPSAWVSAGLSGIYRLAYEAGGPRVVDSGAGAVSLPPEVASAWAVWADVASDSELGEWRETPLDELEDDRGYEAGAVWKRWVPTTKAWAEPEGLEPDTDSRPAFGSTAHRDIFAAYARNHRGLLDAVGEDDPAFAERVFLREVAIPLLEQVVHHYLDYQTPFDDQDGHRRYCDFVLRGERTYAIEIEGHTWHAAQNLDPERFAVERRRVQAYTRLGWHHFPIAFLDLVNGRALANLAEILQADAELGPHVIGGVAVPEGPGPRDDVRDVVRAFAPLQALILSRYAEAVDAGAPIKLRQQGLDFPMLELAVRDLDVLGTHVCHLHGEEWTRPPVEIDVIGAVHERYEAARFAYGIQVEPEAIDRRVDRPLRECADLAVRHSAPARRATMPAFQLGSGQGAPWLSLGTLADLPPLQTAASGLGARRPMPERATARILDAMGRRLLMIPHLRPEQVQVIRGALTGEPLLTVLPTGYGKSLCFQLPALLSVGTTLVISPLKSLMRDQVRSLRQRGLGGVEHVSSDLDPAEKHRCLAKLRRGRLKLLYLAPERFEKRDFAAPLLSDLNHAPIAMVAVDEAHCVSEWGHDFRPAYLRVRLIVERLRAAGRHVPIFGLTATASDPVRRDVCRVLQIRPENVIQSRSIDRPELSLSVHAVEQGSKSDRVAALVSVGLPHILDSPQDSFTRPGAEHGSLLVFGIYAAATGKTTREEGVAHIRHQLVRQGIAPDAVELFASRQPPRCSNCRSIHVSKVKGGGLACENCESPVKANREAERDWVRTLQRTQDAFHLGRFPTLVATKGFGMGIDKPDIRSVVHHCMAGGLEALYQEAGRAGRDRQHAHVALVYRPPARTCIEAYFERFEELGLGDEEVELALDPPCQRDPQSRRFHKCPHQLERWCDYGRQAAFVTSSFPDRQGEIDRAIDLYERLVTMEPPRQIDARNSGMKADAVPVQMALHRLDLLGLIDTYWVSYPHGLRTKRFEVTLPTTWSLESCLASLNLWLKGTEEELPSEVQETLDDLASAVPERPPPDGGLLVPYVGWVASAVGLLVDNAYGKIKAMRYRMLHNLWRYAWETEQRDQCRRWYLTTVLDAQEFARPDDHRCGFCDVCVQQRPLHFGSRQRAVTPLDEWRLDDVSRAAEAAVSSDNLEEIDRLVHSEEAARSPLSLRNMALRHLESRPRSTGAHYLAARGCQRGAEMRPGEAGRLRREAGGHAARAYRIREDAGAGATDLEPFVRVVESNAPTLAVDVMDRARGPFDSLEAVGRMASLLGPVPPDSERGRRVRGALAVHSAELASASLAGILDALANSLNMNMLDQSEPPASSRPPTGPPRGVT